MNPSANLELLQWGLYLTGVLFMFAFGAVCGSFINVIVYRLPRDLNIVTPPSACPHCGTTLTWRENIPVFGWISLGGKCRFCRSPISPEYPIVEFVVGLLFAAMYALWYMPPEVLRSLGSWAVMWRADFAIEGLKHTWPMLVILTALVGSLVASTLIDARTFTIPLVLPWFATAVAFVVHPLHALWIQLAKGELQRAPFTWTIPVPTGGMLGAALGGMLGIVAASLLLRYRLLPQSFADYPEWETQAMARQEEAEAARAASAVAPESREPDTKALLKRTVFLTGPAVALMLLGFSLGMPRGLSLPFMTVGAAAGLLIGLFLRRLAVDPNAAEDARAEEPIWAAYPHARREMFKEILFLLPAVLLGGLGWWMASPGGGGVLGSAASGAPLWLLALGGTFFGYLVGGGLVWIFRIGGTLALGREAMGLGDVHLMAAAGAALGWIDPTLAFFTAPFMGIAWACLSVAFRQVFHRQGTALPYGPHLAAATIMVMLGKPVFELGLSAMFGRSINIP